jgi:hypothetical protein
MPASKQFDAMMRRTVKQYLTDVCTIEQEVQTVDRFNAPIHEWELVAENEPCRVISLGQRYGSGVAEVAAAETMKREYRLIIGRELALGTDMRVTVDGVQYGITRIETQLTDGAFQGVIMQGRD